jgi:hypothetical protein
MEEMISEKKLLFVGSSGSSNTVIVHKREMGCNVRGKPQMCIAISNN